MEVCAERSALVVERSAYSRRTKRRALWLRARRCFKQLRDVIERLFYIVTVGVVESSLLSHFAKCTRGLCRSVTERNTHRTRHEEIRAMIRCHPCAEICLMESIESIACCEDEAVFDVSNRAETWEINIARCAF